MGDCDQLERKRENKNKGAREDREGKKERIRSERGECDQ